LYTIVETAVYRVTIRQMFSRIKMCVHDKTFTTIGPIWIYDVVKPNNSFTCLYTQLRLI